MFSTACAIDIPSSMSEVAPPMARRDQRLLFAVVDIVIEGSISGGHEAGRGGGKIQMPLTVHHDKNVEYVVNLSLL